MQHRHLSAAQLDPFQHNWRENLARNLNNHIVSILKNSDLKKLFENFIAVDNEQFKLKEFNESQLGDKISKEIAKIIKDQTSKFLEQHEKRDATDQELQEFTHELIKLKNSAQPDTPSPKPAITVDFSLEQKDQPTPVNPQENTILSNHYQREIRLSNGDTGQDRFCHVLAARTSSQQEFNEIINAVNQFSTSTAIHTALPANLSEPPRESTLVALIRDPPGKKDYSASDGMMEGVAGFFHYWEQDKDKQSPLCIGGKCDIDTLIQFLNCCLATGREFQFGNASSALTIRLGKDIDPISIPIGAKVSLGVPEILKKYATDNQELSLKLETLKQQINDQNKKLNPSKRIPYINKVNANILSLKEDPQYKDNMATLTKINKFKSYDERFRRRKSEPLLACQPQSAVDPSQDEKGPGINPPLPFNRRKSLP